MKYFLLSLIFTASCLNAINFKEAKPFTYGLWFNGGLGTVLTEDGDILSLNTAVNFAKNNRIMRMKYFYGRELEKYSPTPELKAWEYAVLYGYNSVKGILNISYMAGISYTGGIARGTKITDSTDDDHYNEITYGTIGIPLEIEVDLNALRPFGLGFAFFCDINSENNLIGFNFNILIGRLP